MPDLQGCVHWVGCGGGVAVGEDGALPPWPRRKRAGPGGRTRTDLADLETPTPTPSALASLHAAPSGMARETTLG